MNIRLLLSTTFTVLSLSTVAQDANSSFAITGNGTGDFNWVNIRQVNIKTGLLERTVYNNTPNAVLTDAFSKGSAVTTMVPVMG